MTDKEKARAYDEALERAQKATRAGSDVAIDIVQYIFPQLAESEEQNSSQDTELTGFESALFTAFSYAWQSYLRGEEVNVAQWAKENSAELLEAARFQLGKQKFN